MATDSDQQLKDLLKGDEPDQDGARRVARTMAQVRAGVGARDALIFAVVRVWTVIDGQPYLAVGGFKIGDHLLPPGTCIPIPYF